VEEEEEDLEAILEKEECEEVEITYDEVKRYLRYYRIDYLPGEKEEEPDVEEEEDEVDDEENEGSLVDEEEETKQVNEKSVNEKNSKRQATEVANGENHKTLWVGKADRKRFINAVLSSSSFGYLAMNVEILWDKAALFGLFSNSTTKKNKGKNRR